MASRYGRDGSNYTARAVFDCYYNPKDLLHEEKLRDKTADMFVVIDYQPDRFVLMDTFNNILHILFIRTLFYLMLWSIMPGCIMLVSCVYMCVCSKFMFIGDDGHMRIFCCGKAVTGDTIR